MNKVAITDEIILQNVTKFFGRQTKQIAALQPLSLTIKANGVTGLVGPDGAGKTTLLRILAGLLLPTDGLVNVAGLNPALDGANLRAILGYMPQKFGLYEDLTVQENLTLFADLRKIAKDERKPLFSRLLEFTNLTNFTKRFAGKLSGGMKQKLGLACTLLGSPKVLLLDEPSVGVDPISRQELWKMVNELAQSGMLIIWSTSYLDEAQNCQDILLLNQGQLIFRGAPNELTKRVDGRVYLLSSNQPHRKLLQHALKQGTVSDGVIEGDNIRLIFKQPIDVQDIEGALNDSSLNVTPAKGRFEDAFIDLLGGLKTKESILANIMQPIDCSRQDIVIEAKQLTKKFGNFIATDHVDFSVIRGEIFGLLGPNGAGKSTIFKMMCGLLSISSGQALVLNLDLKNNAIQARQNLGYMAQRFSLYDNLTVRQNLQFFSGIYGLYGDAQRTSINEMITAFDFAAILDRTPAVLSLGYKQRLALACALMHRPEIIFLDEPTSGVDPITRREFWLQINSLVEKGVTVMVTTHFMDEAEYCDRIGLVNHGQLIALGSPDQLKRAIATQAMPNPTMEHAFIQLVLNSSQPREGV
ncbi:ATP-binding cassette domain-containing protein [Orbus sturtevantii]|uniref:ATP-binding cassette domain-containing protein n=1 Tax=Orbus sturtevantii TaxID=3074109 RepID=UPI00370DB426